MKRKRQVISDSVVMKRLGKIQRKIHKEAKKQVRKKLLTGVSMELYLGKIDARYEQLRAQVATGYATAQNELKQRRAELFGQAQNELNLLGNDTHRLQQAYQSAQLLSKQAQLAEAKIPTRDRITIDPLRERMASLKRTGLETEDR